MPRLTLQRETYVNPAYILGELLVITVDASAAVYPVTKDRRWLRLSRQILKFSLTIILIFLDLLALERLAIAI